MTLKLGYVPEICFTSRTAKNRLQVLIPKESHFCTTFSKGPVLGSKPSAKAMRFSGYQFSSWSHFLKRVRIFFFSTYLRSARRVRSNHHVSAEQTSDISGLYMYHLLAAIRNCCNKCKVSEEHEFRK